MFYTAANLWTELGPLPLRQIYTSNFNIQYNHLLRQGFQEVIRVDKIIKMVHLSSKIAKTKHSAMDLVL